MLAEAFALDGGESPQRLVDDLLRGTAGRGGSACTSPVRTTPRRC